MPTLQTQQLDPQHLLHPAQHVQQDAQLVLVKLLVKHAQLDILLAHKHNFVNKILEED